MLPNQTVLSTYPPHEGEHDETKHITHFQFIPTHKIYLSPKFFNSLIVKPFLGYTRLKHEWCGFALDFNLAEGKITAKIIGRHVNTVKLSNAIIGPYKLIESNKKGICQLSNVNDWEWMSSTDSFPLATIGNLEVLMLNLLSKACSLGINAGYPNECFTDIEYCGEEQCLQEIKDEFNNFDGITAGDAWEMTRHV